MKISGIIVPVTGPLEKRGDIEMVLESLRQKGSRCGIISRGKKHMVVRAVNPPCKRSYSVPEGWTEKEVEEIYVPVSKDMKRKVTAKELELEKIRLKCPSRNWTKVEREFDDAKHDILRKVTVNLFKWYHGKEEINLKRDREIVVEDFNPKVEVNLEEVDLFKEVAK